jgi:glucose/mannose transport system permease protein
MKLTRDRWTAILMLLPSVVLIGVFVYGFIGQTAWTSFSDWGRVPAQALAVDPEIEMVGWQNYRDLFTGFIDVRFRQDLVNTFFFTIFFLAGCLGLGLGLAFLLDQDVKGEGFFRTLFLFPMSLSFVVTGTDLALDAAAARRRQRAAHHGRPARLGVPLADRPHADLALRLERAAVDDRPAGRRDPGSWSPCRPGGAVGARGRRWRSRRALADRRLGPHAGPQRGAPPLSRAARLQPRVHRHHPGRGLADVGLHDGALPRGPARHPRELREAARVDGANEVQLYRHVVLPLLQPITLSAMIILGHISLKIFDLVFAMAGADNATTDVPALLMYLTAFRANQFSKGAAIAMVLLVMVAAVIVPYLWTSLRGETRR